MRELISARVGFGPARRVLNVASMVKACSVLRRVFRSLRDGDDDRGRFGLVGKGDAIFVVQFDEDMEN